MVAPAHSRLTFSGVRGGIGAPLETWGWSLNFLGSATIPGFSDAQIDAVAQTCRAAYVARLAVIMQADTILTETRFASIDSTNHVMKRADGSFVQGIDPTQVPGTGQSNSTPLECALVVSLSTLRPGASGKGRVFLPWPAMLPAIADKRIAIADAQDLMDRFATFLGDLNGLGAQAVCVSSSKGFNSVVNGIRVGRVPDVLRSRRRSQPEGYLSRSL